VLAAVAALTVVLYGADDLFLPRSPTGFTANPCPGTPVLGAAFYAQTQQYGVSARSGPGESYPQVNRFGGNCVLGFDGFCVGAAVFDFTTGAPDQLWLILHRRHELIAEAVLLLQSPASLIGRQPLNGCREIGGLPMPRPITALHFDLGSEHITSMASGANLVGYASLSSENRIKQVGIATNPSDRFSVKWNPLSAPVSSGPSVVIIEAVDCLANQDPIIGTSSTLSVHISAGRIVSTGCVFLQGVTFLVVPVMR